MKKKKYLEFLKEFFFFLFSKQCHDQIFKHIFFKKNFSIQFILNNLSMDKKKTDISKTFEISYSQSKNLERNMQFVCYKKFSLKETRNSGRVI